MTLVALAAIALSSVLIALLCLGDPKRRRTAGHGGTALTSGPRRLLATFACLPGLYFAVLGDAAAFLIWLGGCGVIGWVLTMAFAARGSSPR